jgi:hypothetical protein
MVSSAVVAAETMGLGGMPGTAALGATAPGDVAKAR